MFLEFSRLVSVRRDNSSTRPGGISFSHATVYLISLFPGLHVFFSASTIPKDCIVQNQPSSHSFFPPNRNFQQNQFLDTTMRFFHPCNDISSCQQSLGCRIAISFALLYFLISQDLIRKFNCVNFKQICGEFRVLPGKTWSNLMSGKLCRRFLRGE